MHKQGQYLKEATYSFLINHETHPKEVKLFLGLLVDIMGTEVTCLNVHKLPPGFDIYCGIKESCIYFGYWGEHDFCHIFVSSCKNFDEKEIKDFIQTFFTSKKINMKVVHNTSILNEIARLQNERT